jgi:prolyl-tRNA editing enzyme YbaK/EbsC (Cys-tRNA(Pro) deacylase)
MIPKKLQAYLAKIGVPAEGVVHRKVFTAYDLAKTTGAKLETIAKTILVKVEPPYGEGKSKHVILALPASHRLNLASLKKALRAKKVSIANEKMMTKLFSLKAGALTPFGAIHKRTPVIVDKALLKVKRVMARSGSFTDSIFLKPKDFLVASSGIIAQFSKKLTGKR